MTATTTKPRIFETLRQTQNRPSADSNLRQLVELAISAITSNRSETALYVLRELGACITLCKSQLDRYPQKLVDNIIAVKLLQKENCELRLELARFKNEEESIAILEESLATFDEFFAEAIAYLDPDRQ